jgi:hypothetical protein
VSELRLASEKKRELGVTKPPGHPGIGRCFVVKCLSKTVRDGTPPYDLHLEMEHVEVSFLL